MHLNGTFFRISFSIFNFKFIRDKEQQSASLFHLKTLLYKNMEVGKSYTISRKCCCFFRTKSSKERRIGAFPVCKNSGFNLISYLLNRSVVMKFRVKTRTWNTLIFMLCVRFLHCINLNFKWRELMDIKVLLIERTKFRLHLFRKAIIINHSLDTW